jgi:hypothetical protein
MDESSIRSHSNKESGLEPIAYLSEQNVFLELLTPEAMIVPLVAECQKVVSYVADFKIP